jgi:hypothetical protein
MDLTPEGLRTRALTVFGITQTKRVGLPRKKTPFVVAQGEAIYKRINSNLVDHPFIKHCVRNLLVYNKARKNPKEHLGLFLVLFPDQCERLDESVLKAQCMCIPEEGLGNLRLANIPDNMLDTPRILMRVEIYLTQEEDTNTWDLRILDPDYYIGHDDDVDNLQRRLVKEAGIPKELLEEMRQLATDHPEECKAWLQSHGDESKSNNALMTFMRSCEVCKKFGFTLPKCSGCKSVYYCSTECQNTDWKKHKIICGKGL